MMVSTPSIVLRRVRHHDNRLVVTLYCRNQGLVPAIFYNRKKDGRTGLLEPLSVLETVISSRANREMQEIKSVRLLHPLQEIRSDIRKNAIAVFMAEIILLCTRHAGQDGKLFRFLLQSILDLEQSGSPATFHVKFLVGFLGELGIAPRNNYSEATPCLDPVEGIFTASLGGNDALWPTQESRILWGILNQQDPGMLSPALKRNLLTLLLEYYARQLHITPDPRSREILTEVFR